MDDEVGFGSSVWSAPSDPPRLLNLTSAAFSMPSPALSHDQFDDFEDFHTPPQTQNPSIAQDDDFADFADFGGAEESESTFTFEEEVDFGEEVAVVEPSQLTWRTLQLDPLPAEKDLKQQIEVILGPEWTQDLSDVTVEGDVRQVEGISQILVDPESRQLYNMLVNSPPLIEPINWIRSRIRQQHLISLGLPVNLDEMLPQASVNPLPPLHVSTRPMSLPPVAPNNPLRNMPASRDNSRPGTPRPNTPQPAVRPGMPAVKQLGLGPKPRLDEQRINELLSLDPDELNLFPLAKVEAYLSDLKSETTNTSSLLTYLLQTRDALQQDSETYNKLIAELVSEVQKSKTGKKTVKRSGTIS
ncbi:hypothetical protein SCLCIDRAFT_1209111 [Scleroderma citrinum Foug A]|uniref:Uncharacterized protein n=1 Tax=Scleroderma citrinum Foug A TaxID=1036808 RepID=A0A0C3A5C8_9AGAM|nr:hypothetical protein SCLCIDRAFT_1209111 [Scleroderma citrinum Foug A]